MYTGISYCFSGDPRLHEDEGGLKHLEFITFGSKNQDTFSSLFYGVLIWRIRLSCFFFLSDKKLLVLWYEFSKLFVRNRINLKPAPAGAKTLIFGQGGSMFTLWFTLWWVSVTAPTIGLIYYLIDRHYYKRNQRFDPPNHPWSLSVLFASGLACLLLKLSAVTDIINPVYIFPIGFGLGIPGLWAIYDFFFVRAKSA